MVYSPRTQMQKVLELRTPERAKKAAAEHVLEHEYWFPVLRGSQAYFRNFVLDLVYKTNELGLDDRKMPIALKNMMESGYLWYAFNKIKHPATVSNSLVIALNSLRFAGVKPTPHAIQRVFTLLVEPARPLGRIELIRQDKPDNMVGIDIKYNPHLDPEITHAVLADAGAVKKLASIIDVGIEHTGQAIAILEQDIQPALMDGAL